MSIENLTLEKNIDDEKNLPKSELVSGIGGTVFEALAVDEKEAFVMPDTEIDTKILSSVTRLGDGQTVPDER